MSDPGPEDSLVSHSISLPLTIFLHFHARIQKVLSGGPTVIFFFFFLIVFFLVDEGRGDPNTTISGPSSGHQRIRWCAGDGPTLNAGLVAL